MTKILEITPRAISEYCKDNISRHLGPLEVDKIYLYLVALARSKTVPPYKGIKVNIAALAADADVDIDRLRRVRKRLKPILDVLRQENASLKQKDANAQITPNSSSWASSFNCEKPKPLWSEWRDTDDFAKALRLHMRRHGDTFAKLSVAISDDAASIHGDTLSRWCRSKEAPQKIRSLEILRRLELRYDLPPRYFQEKLPFLSRASQGHPIGNFPQHVRQRLAWHIPDDYHARSPAEQEKILDWAHQIIFGDVSGFRRFVSAAVKNPYSLRFSTHASLEILRNKSPLNSPAKRRPNKVLPYGTSHAPVRLDHELVELVKFYTQDFTPIGTYRRSIWNKRTAAFKTELLSRFFGALVAAADGPVKGLGAEPSKMTLALLVFPPVWDWFLNWRFTRRGFHTVAEVSILVLVQSLVRPETGWLRQSTWISDNLDPIEGLLLPEDIEAAQADWNGACDKMHKFGRVRILELRRIARRHRDPFEAILPVLEAPNPIVEYRKITREILRLIPNEQLYPRPAAEAVRAFLMLRLGMHLGLRQKNLRQLLLCRKGENPTPEKVLNRLLCGELRWNSNSCYWEVFVPAAAFKNSKSSYFKDERPFLLALPQYDNLYYYIDEYIDRHRSTLLGDALDPKTFFVKTVVSRSVTAVYEGSTFYNAWRHAIERYGIYNPFTKRGAIHGLLPHGPHNVRDVLATHVLKKTGSFELAGYAIQASPIVVAKHYGRFLPQDKAVLAAQVLNEAWAEE